MSIIKEMVGRKVISGFRGVLDYYYYMGVACVRRWPKSPGSGRSPSVRAWWAPFTTASKLWNELSPEVRRTYEKMATGSGLSPKDLFMRAYMKGLYRAPIP